MIFLVILLSILIAIILCILYIKKNVSTFSMKYFGTSDLKEAIDKSEITASETPKTVFSVESVVLKKIAKDFPDTNINEIKALAEKSIREVFNAIESKNSSNFGELPTVKAFIDSKINDYKGENIVYDNLKFHNTVVNMYTKSGGSGNITLQASFEYYKKIGDKIGKKVQDRLKIEFVYIIDELQYDGEVKAIGLKCPNCGAPVTSLGNKVCSYCGTGIKDLVKKNWVLNKIKQD